MTNSLLVTPARELGGPRRHVWRCWFVGLEAPADRELRGSPER